MSLYPQSREREGSEDMKRSPFPDSLREIHVAWDDHWKQNKLTFCQEAAYTDDLIHGDVEVLASWKKISHRMLPRFSLNSNSEKKFNIDSSSEEARIHQGHGLQW
jgi:hypothetical protein